VREVRARTCPVAQDRRGAERPTSSEARRLSEASPLARLITVGALFALSWRIFQHVDRQGTLGNASFAFGACNNAPSGSLRSPTPTGRGPAHDQNASRRATGRNQTAAVSTPDGSAAGGGSSARHGGAHPQSKRAVGIGASSAARPEASDDRAASGARDLREPPARPSGSWARQRSSAPSEFCQNH
jgi:hypothetical protein